MLLLEDKYGLSKADILAGSFFENDQRSLEEDVQKLLMHEPIQYITGVADFYGRTFQVRQGVLIPRPETEELVDLIIKSNTEASPKILDIGVGSGCIAISLALAFKCEVFGLDVSDVALMVSDQNARKHKAALSLIKQDVLTEDIGMSDLDILVSNPPYIPREEQAEMRGNVIGYEPEEALFVKTNDPLIFYDRIAREGKRALKEGGRLYFEIHEKFGKEVCNLLEDLRYRSVILHEDMHGKDRIVVATNSTST